LEGIASIMGCQPIAWVVGVFHPKRVWYASTFEIHFVFVVFISCSIIFHIPFHFLFESLVLIIFRIDSLCYSRDYHRRFVLLVFWVLLLLESYLRIWIGLLSWFYLVLVSVPQGCCFIVLHILFLFLFESSISFIFRIDSLATR
jgi:hypothetical protein